MLASDRIPVPECTGTTVEKLFETDGLQFLKVVVEPGGEIPLHTHACAATMIVTQGSAHTLGKDGRVVHKGDVVVKTPNEPHGFTEIQAPFSFISISGGEGIVRDGKWDMQFVGSFLA